MKKLRGIEPMKWRDIVPGGKSEPRPETRMVDPASLYVDETYQRDLADKSVKLIRRILSNWSWSRFKLPIVTDSSGKLVVIDGQHTAIAAASHPEIKRIPVLVVATEGVAEQAQSFVSHNQDRIAVTQMQIFHADLVSGDEIALAVKECCDKTGAKVLRSPPPYNIYKPGETIAIGTLKSLVSRRGPMVTRKVLEVLVKARLAPIRSPEVKAVEQFLFTDEFGKVATGEDLTNLMLLKGPAMLDAARSVASSQVIPMWRALCLEWAKALKLEPKRRAAA
jgi:hypothetical protein